LFVAVVAVPAFDVCGKTAVNEPPIRIWLLDWIAIA